MMCLPDSCHHIIETIDLLYEDSHTVDYVHEKLMNRKELDIVSSKVNKTVHEKAENPQVFRAKIVSDDQKGKFEPIT